MIMSASLSITRELGGLSRSRNSSHENFNAISRLPRSHSFSSIYVSEKGQMQRSSSHGKILCIAKKVQASTTQPKLKEPNHFHFPSSLIPNHFRSFLLDQLARHDAAENMAGESEEKNGEMEVNGGMKRANWVERIMELQRKWRQKQEKDEEHISAQLGHEDLDENGGGEGCEVQYDENGTNEEAGVIDEAAFSRLLSPVPWSDTKLFSKLAFLSNMAYVVTGIKLSIFPGQKIALESGLWEGEKHLRRYYGLDLVTSSLMKKAEDRSERGEKENKDSRKKYLPQPLVAYEIAASAASFVRSQPPTYEPGRMDISDAFLHATASNQQDQEDESAKKMYKSEMAAFVATSAMTTLVAANEEQKKEAVKDLQSIQNSPCEWFVCDDPSTYTRHFIIQGSDSLASWQANLLFEPSDFEETGALVHRGIYEAAKGIYEQLLPEITQHLERFGSRAKLQFAGHSLGGSLSLLVNLMLLTRKVAAPSALLPVVTFGSPFVFCGGQKILNMLGLDENHVHCVIMHRDIIPRAFSCLYPNHIAEVLKRLCGTFRSHPCLNKNKMLYLPMGKIFILQPDEKSSPRHPLLPPGYGLYALDGIQCASTASALKAFLNNPHPLETLSDLTAYGSEGTILRDHDSSNYLKAVNEVIRQQSRQVRKVREQSDDQLWPLLTSQSPHAWSHDRNLKETLGV